MHPSQENDTDTLEDSDLTNCTSYFDGCNTCTVQDGKIGGCTRMFCETPEAPKCLEYATGTSPMEPSHVANPASENCQSKG
jgi:hypothetical protein